MEPTDKKRGATGRSRRTQRSSKIVGQLTQEPWGKLDNKGGGKEGKRQGGAVVSTREVNQRMPGPPFKFNKPAVPERSPTDAIACKKSHHHSRRERCGAAFGEGGICHDAR